MGYQAGVLDSIPYQLQADQLLSYIDKARKNGKEDKEMAEMFKAYRDQDLKKLEEMMMQSDAGISNFTDIFLYNRNENWVAKLKSIFASKSVLVAVGAGHLPGEKGVINLLRKQGYIVTPVENKHSNLRVI